MTDPLRKKLKAVDEEIQQLHITVEDPSASTHYKEKKDQDPIASLVIPNKLYLLWDRRVCLQKDLGVSVSKHSDMANSRIKRDHNVVIRSSASTVEKRLVTASNKFLKKYRQPKKGSTYRNKILKHNTNMLLYKSEVVDKPVFSTPLQYKGNPYTAVMDRQKQRKLGAIRDDLQYYFGPPLAGIGLFIESVNLTTEEPLDPIKVKVDYDDGHKEHEEHMIEHLTYLLLKHGVSMEFYHEVAMRFKDLPRSYKLKRFKQSIKVPTISKTPGPYDGAQFDFKDIVIKLAKSEIEDNADYYSNNKLLMIKISGDGAKYSHTSSFCLLSFAFVRDDSSLSTLDVHTIAAIKAQESYEALRDGFADAFASINSLISSPQLEIGGETYELKIVFCADYKFLLLIMGMKAANSKNSCIWCTVSEGDRHDMKLAANKCQKRTLQSIKNCAMDETLGCKDSPLLNLEPEYIICDELHLLLRVMDHLIQALINTAKAYDASEAHILGLRSIKATEGEMIQKLTKTINDCGIHFYVWEDKKKDELQWPSMMGPSKKKLLKLLPDKLIECQPTNMVDPIKKLWKDFSYIYSEITSRSPSCTAEELKTKGKEWIESFTELSSAEYPVSDGYDPERISPYMHLMVMHVPSMIRIYGDIKKFSCQAVEKKNDNAKKIFFRSSNKWDPTTDMLKTEDKIRQLQHCEREKRPFRKDDDEWWCLGGIEEARRKIPRISRVYETDTST